LVEAFAIPLSVLLGHVKEEETLLQGAKKESLIAIAEFILNSRQPTVQEHREAVAVLAKYHLAALVDLHRPRRSRQLIEIERQRPYDRRCARCGLIITAKESLKTGYGNVCRRKLGLGARHVAPEADARRRLHEARKETVTP
jgi:hypothetical protein